MVQSQSEPSPPAPKAASGIHSSRYAKDRKELISLMNNMRAAGVGLELDLPRIAIIGKSRPFHRSLTTHS